MSEWLLSRLFDSGDQPEPRFAVQSTLNWMRALAILVEDCGFTDEQLFAFYEPVQRRKPNVRADTGVFERMLMAQHHTAALSSLSSEPRSPYNVVRSAIISWYYVIYESCSAMILAASGSNAEEHRKTARIWHEDIVIRNLAVKPFDLHLDTLVAGEVKTRIKALRQGLDFALVDVPHSPGDAWGAACAYVSGTAAYEKWRVEQRLRDNHEFKKLNTDSFRTKAARNLRDSKLTAGYVNFLIQAFRYRGKANYRDSIYLSYGPNREPAIRQFLVDLATVGSAYCRMAGAFASRRVERGSWASFLEDLDRNSLLDRAFA